MTQAAGTGGRTPVVWMFSGQGAQYFGMGRALYDSNPTFRSWMDRLDEVAAGYVGQSIVEILYGEGRAKSQPFEHILHTHPALFMVQYALAETLRAEGFPAPDHLLGASLGEFVAAAVAGVAGPDAMLFDVIKQARLFEAHCSGGAMLVVIDDVVAFRANPVFASSCELAGVNFDRCFVVSGSRGEIERIAAVLKQQDVTHQLLPVSMAFHSSLIDGVKEVFVRSFSGRTFGSPGIPVVSCAPDFAGPSEGARFSPAYWWNVVREPIEFQRVLAGFARVHPTALYMDLGPSGNMATFTKYNLPAAMHGRIMPVMTPFGHDLENMRAARETLRVAHDPD